MSAIWRRAAQLRVQGLPFAAAMRQARIELDPDYRRAQSLAAHGSLVYKACGHARRKVGEGEADGVVVDAWRCDTCEDVLLERRP